METQAEQTQTQKLQEMLSVSWYESEVTDNRHIVINERLTITPELANDLVKELEVIVTMAQIGEKPSALQQIAYHLLANSH